MKKSLFFAIFLIFLTSIAVCAETFTTPDGFPFEVNLIADKNEIIVGEPVYLSFEVKNLSDAELSFTDGGDYRNRLGRPLSFNVRAVRSDGRQVPVPEITLDMGGLVGSRKVPKNGGTYSVRLLLPLWAPFTETGDYDIFCEKNLGIRSNGKKTKDISYVGGRAVPVAVRTRLKVVAADDAKMSEVIDSWGEKLFNAETWEKSHEAVRALDHIEDKRVIKPLVKALTREEESPASDTIIRVLNKFETEETFAIIAGQINSKSNNIRRAVAAALGDSKNPKAFENLLKLKDDNDNIVRFWVLMALGQIGTPQAIKILKEMMKEVRNQQFYEAVKTYLEVK